MKIFHVSRETGEELRKQALDAIKAVEQIHTRLARGLGIDGERLAIANLKLSQGETHEAVLALFGAVDCGTTDVYFIRADMAKPEVIGKWYLFIAEFTARIDGDYLKYKMFCEKGELQ